MKVSGTGEVLSNWEDLKRKEKGQKTNTDALSAVAGACPPCGGPRRSRRRRRRPDLTGRMSPVRWTSSEEIEELKTAVAEGSNIEGGAGDLLFPQSMSPFL